MPEQHSLLAPQFWPLATHEQVQLPVMSLHGTLPSGLTQFAPLQQLVELLHAPPCGTHSPWTPSHVPRLQ